MTSPRLLRDLLPPEFRPGLETLARPPHTRRVVMLGDSYTFGFGLPEREGLAAQLEVELNRTTPGALFEVLNLGRPGLNLLEELAVFDMVSAELAHDLVVVSLGDDDAHPWTRNELAHLGGRWEEQWRGQWAEDNPAAPFLKDGLRELARRTRAAGTPLVGDLLPVGGGQRPAGPAPAGPLPGAGGALRGPPGPLRPLRAGAS